VLSPPQGAYVIGPVVFEGGAAPLAIPPRSVEVEGLGTVTLELSDNELTASLGDGASAAFDIADAMKEVYRRGWPKVDDHSPIGLKAKANGLDGTMIIDNLNGTYKSPDFDVSLLRFWLVLGKAD